VLAELAAAELAEVAGPRAAVAEHLELAELAGAELELAAPPPAASP
jgi:hypothetical protein